MELVEFLEHTDNRNLKYNISNMVKQRLRDRDEVLKIRRINLGNILEFENLKYKEEMALLITERIEGNARKRHECIGIMRIERKKAEEDFLKLKEMQREGENCEALRHLQSKQIHMETKQAQIYQIEEKKMLRRREKQIDLMWLNASKKLNDEKEEQYVYGKNLRKIIADINQVKNAKQDVDLKLKAQN